MARLAQGKAAPTARTWWHRDAVAIAMTPKWGHGKAWRSYKVAYRENEVRQLLPAHGVSEAGERARRCLSTYLTRGIHQGPTPGVSMFRRGRCVSME